MPAALTAGLAQAKTRAAAVKVRSFRAGNRIFSLGLDLLEIDVVEEPGRKLMFDQTRQGRGSLTIIGT